MSVLWNTFSLEISLLVNTKGYFARYVKEDPEQRMKCFFSKVEGEIDQVFDMGMCE